MPPPLSGWTIWITGFVGKAPALDEFMSFLASDFFIPVLICLIMLTLWLSQSDRFKREKIQRAVMNTAVAIGISTLGVHIVNTFWDPWPRPFLVDDPAIQESARHAAQTVFYFAHDPSFPSNATTIAFAAATGIFLGNRKVGILVYVLATCWAMARLYAGIHFFVDILAGVALGVLIALFICKVFMPRMEPFPSWAMNLFRFLYLA